MVVRKTWGRAPIAAFLLGASACLGRGNPSPPDAAARFRVDGDLAEWTAVPVAASNGREVTGADLRAVYAVADEEALHLRFDFERPVNIQSMAGTLRLALDGDGETVTGARVAALEGAEITVDFSVARSGVETGSGVRLRLGQDTTSRSVHEIALTYAPTHEATSYEVDIPRIAGDRALLPGRTLNGLLVMLDATGAPVEVFGPFRVQAPVARAPQPHADPRNLERATGTAVRVLVWNVGDRTPLVRPEPYRRVLRAADPDVVLLDELNPALDEAGVRALLPGGDEWSLILGTGGGRQRTAVASRLPLQAAPALTRVPWPDSVAALAGVPMMPQVRSDLASAASDGIPAVGGVVTVGPLRVLFVALDLACCGLAGSGEDRARAIAASAIHSAIRSALDEGAADAAVIGGDINLVGSRRPLETLREQLDRAGGDLAAADLLTPDGRSYSTWRSPGPFPPGRLDWVLFPMSVLEQVGGMVLDTGLLGATARAGLGLEATDAQVTDHLPLVVDFALRHP